ncbi:ATP-dependent DNA ligase [Candidatus Tenderia electrophaga]|jgi:DNA ligase D-like protein (predicted ligase)|uniref:DNA ligase (ATP) n=1 Tax=Candidatus Tenderia electrophaga TaxID=1748243 RepID=A0A0S2TFK7_9GAMM|nr:ATP-dependent DNA ligase [Candidatus Tenderia electrophaga]
MTDWRDQLSAAQRQALTRKTMPKWTEPMLATLTDARFSADDWIFERKLDGERCLVFRRKSRLHILSRNRQDLNDTYPELVRALSQEGPEHYIVDGEIVAFEGRRTSFSRLQGRIGIDDPDAARASGIKVYLYLFDLLYLDNADLTGLPLRRRKQLLRRCFDFKDPLRFTAHRNECGEAYYQEACDKGWEGLIAKRADSPYVHSRSKHWLKFKCVKRQELVIAGYTDPQGSRIGFGALLLGYYHHKQLRYAGKVGTGFDDKTLKQLGETLKSMQQDDCPYAETPNQAGKDVHWVKPTLVAEIGFTEWTADQRLRHPRFVGLRHDKAATQVVRETPE